jgi:hypothetical protein
MLRSKGFRALGYYEPCRCVQGSCAVDIKAVVRAIRGLERELGAARSPLREGTTSLAVCDGLPDLWLPGRISSYVVDASTSS